jgi:hypothetical protein
MTRIVLILSLMCSWIATFAQEVSTYVSSKEVSVGEVLVVQYEINLPKGQVIRFNPPVGDFPCKRIAEQSNLAGSEFTELEIVSYSDTVLYSNGTSLWRAQFKLIPWDTGTLVLQPLPYTLNNQMDYFTSILIESSFVPTKKGIRIYDIDESITPIKKDFILSEFLLKYFWIPIILLLVVLSILWYKRRQRRTTPAPISLTLKQQTLQSIEKIIQKKQWETNQKTHYTEFSFILRWYLSARYNINLLERTTFETILLLNALALDEYLLVQIKQIFAEVDSVKFAKTSLTPDQHDKLLEQLKEVVIISSPVETQHV